MRNYTGYIVLAVALAAVSGCVWVGQLVKDNKTGRDQATQEERDRISRETQGIQDFLRGIPVAGGPAAAAAGLILPFLGFAGVGRARRKGQPAAEGGPISGWLGSRKLFGLLAVEDVIQFLANANSGAMEWGKDGSPLKRSWKTLVAYAGSLAVGALAVPGVREWVVSQPITATIVGVLTAAAAGISKALDAVKPVKPPADGSGT